MNTSYEAWAKFDVDAALERVDLLEQQQQIARQKQQKVAEKRRVEDTISSDAEQSAEVLAAHAAVAALKAKARSRGAKKAPLQPPPPQSNDGPARQVESNALCAETAEQLQNVAAMMQQKHALIKATMTARRRGDALLEEGSMCDWSEAKKAYESALASASALEALVPQLMELQRRPLGATQTDNGNQQHHHHGGRSDGDTHEKSECCDDHDHGHSHDHEHCASKPPPSKKPVKETLPPKDDLDAVVKMFLKDCYIGIGSCEMGSRHFAGASEAFKEVLLRDDNHLLAWLQRGRAFEALDAPLLAWLHFNRVTSVDPAFEDAKECEERIKHVLISGSAPTSVHSALTETRPLKELLQLIMLQMDAGNVIMIEGFFAYAIIKFDAAIELLSIVRTKHSLAGTHENVVTKLDTTCHLNIASCYLEMQKQFPTALKHCQLALDNDPGHIVANFRLAQIHRAMHEYDQALECYHTVRMLVSYLPHEDATKQLIKLDEEMDKCQFDRSQYDSAYIRQQMQN